MDTKDTPKDENTYRLLNRKEAAQFLGFQESTLAVWKSTKRYALPTVKIGRLVKYRLEDLLTFIETHRTCMK